MIFVMYAPNPILGWVNERWRRTVHEGEKSLEVLVWNLKGRDNGGGVDVVELVIVIDGSKRNILWEFGLYLDDWIWSKIFGYFKYNNTYSSSMNQVISWAAGYYQLSGKTLRGQFWVYYS
jgi:hypothetical protein